jgi:hypothetical protein
MPTLAGLIAAIVAPIVVATAIMYPLSLTPLGNYNGPGIKAFSYFMVGVILSVAVMAFRGVKSWAERQDKLEPEPSERNDESLHPETQTQTDRSQQKPFDVEKWNALLRYDDDIAKVAEKLRPLGDKWVDELARAYLVLNDKQYLPSIVQKIIADARKEDEQRQQRHEGKEQRTSTTSAQQAAAARGSKRMSVGALVWICVAVGGIALFGGIELFRAWRLHQMLLIAQSEIQKQLPKKIDDDTTLVGVRVGYTDWTYVYDVTARKSAIDAPALQRLESQIRRGVCASDMSARLRDGVSYNYEYRDTTGVMITKFQITSCP